MCLYMRWRCYGIAGLVRSPAGVWNGEMFGLVTCRTLKRTYHGMYTWICYNKLFRTVKRFRYMCEGVMLAGSGNPMNNALNHFIRSCCFSCVWVRTEIYEQHGHCVTCFVLEVDLWYPVESQHVALIHCENPRLALRAKLRHLRPQWIDNLWCFLIINE